MLSAVYWLVNCPAEHGEMPHVAGASFSRSGFTTLDFGGQKGIYALYPTKLGPPTYHCDACGHEVCSDKDNTSWLFRPLESMSGYMRFCLRHEAETVLHFIHQRHAEQMLIWIWKGDQTPFGHGHTGFGCPHDFAFRKEIRGYFVLKYEEKNCRFNQTYNICKLCFPGAIAAHRSHDAALRWVKWLDYDMQISYPSIRCCNCHSPMAGNTTLQRKRKICDHCSSQRTFTLPATLKFQTPAKTFLDLLDLPVLEKVLGYYMERPLEPPRMDAVTMIGFLNKQNSDTIRSN